MAPKNTHLSSDQAEITLAHALSEAAVALQQAAYSEEDIFPVFHKQINWLGLRGGILLLDESGERLTVVSTSESSQFNKILLELEKLVGIKAKGYSFAITDIAVYRQVIETAGVVFEGGEILISHHQESVDSDN